MEHRIKEAFDQVHAEEELKRRTKDYILQGRKEHRKVYRHTYAWVASITLFLVIGGWMYMTPTTVISVDINPSIELNVNCFDRVVSAEGYNEDGKELLDTLDVTHQNFEVAMEKLVESPQITDLLSKDEVLTIVVTGEKEVQSQKIVTSLQAQIEQQKNMYCYYAKKEEVQKAHEFGLSYGKYRAYLEAKEKNPNISVQDIKDLTMREIRNLGDEATIIQPEQKNNGRKNMNKGRKQRKGIASDNAT